MEQNAETKLKKKRIKLIDGRYMIFYTFEGLPALPPEETQATCPKRDPKPQTEDDRFV
jgi:hypothetical protein